MLGTSLSPFGRSPTSVFGAVSLRCKEFTLWLCCIWPVRQPELIGIDYRAIRPFGSRWMRYIGTGTRLGTLTDGQFLSEVQQHHQVVRVNGTELYRSQFPTTTGAAGSCRQICLLGRF